jgi:hypothetical protein
MFLMGKMTMLYTHFCDESSGYCSKHILSLFCVTYQQSLTSAKCRIWVKNLLKFYTY